MIDKVYKWTHKGLFILLCAWYHHRWTGRKEAFGWSSGVTGEFPPHFSTGKTKNTLPISKFLLDKAPLMHLSPHPCSKSPMKSQNQPISLPKCHQSPKLHSSLFLPLPLQIKTAPPIWLSIFRDKEGNQIKWTFTWNNGNLFKWRCWNKG